MTRADVTQKILSAKLLKGLTWKQILAELGGSSVYVAAGLCASRLNYQQGA